MANTNSRVVVFNNVADAFSIKLGSDKGVKLQQTRGEVGDWSALDLYTK